VNSGGMANGYDDTELRGRIVGLENEKANASDLSAFFNKSVDKIDGSLVDSDFLAAITNYDGLLTEESAENLYRNKNTLIEESDLSAAVKGKLNNQGGGGEVPSSVLGDIEEIKEIIADHGQNIENLENDLGNYRLTSAKIGMNDLSSALITQLQKYRDVDTKITATDLDDALIGKINDIENLNEFKNAWLTGLPGNVLFATDNDSGVLYDGMVKTGNFFASPEELDFALNNLSDFYDISSETGTRYFINENSSYRRVRAKIQVNADGFSCCLKEHEL
jgi:hypothetical protein